MGVRQYEDEMVPGVQLVNMPRDFSPGMGNNEDGVPKFPEHKFRYLCTVPNCSSLNSLL